LNTLIQKNTSYSRGIVEAKLQPEDIPDLILFSDMQFDEASDQNAAWKTNQERIARRFKEEGWKICGKAWLPPLLSTGI
jgi:hypothetical protein